MKTLIRKTLAALAVAIGFTTAATAATPVAVAKNAQTQKYQLTIAIDENGQWSSQGSDINEPAWGTDVTSGTIRKAGTGKCTIAQHNGFTYEVAEGTLELEATGDYGTITVAENARLDVGTRRGVSVTGSGKVDVTLTENDYKYGNEITAFTPTSGSTAEVGKVYKPNGEEIDEQGRLTISGNKVTINLYPTVFTVTQITPTAQTNFNGSVVTVAYSNFEKGDYETVTFKLTVGDEEFTVDAPADKSSGNLTFHVSDTAAAASNLCNAVVSVVGSTTKVVIEGKGTSEAYRNTAWLYQGARSTVTTNDWFSTSANGTSVSSTDGSWKTDGEAGNPPAADSKIVFDEDAQGEYHDYAFVPSAAQNGQVAVVDFNIYFDAAFDDYEEIPADSQAAIRVVMVADDAYRFATLVNGAWVTNTSYVVSLETEYAVRMTLDYRQIPGMLTYEVKTGDAAAYTTLDNTGALRTDRSAVRDVFFNGTGRLASLAGDRQTDSVDASLVEDGAGSKYATLNDALGHDGLKLLWNASWTPSTMPANFSLAANGHNLYLDADYQGVKIVLNGTTYEITGNYFEAIAYGLDGVLSNATEYTYLTNAIVKCAEGATNVLLRTVTLPAEAVAVAKSVTIAGDTNELTGAGFVLAAGKTLTIQSGFIGIGNVTGEGALKLTGGRYTDEGSNRWNSATYLDGKYRFGAITVVEKAGYRWQVLEGSEPVAADEVVLPVKDAKGNDVGTIALSDGWVKTVVPVEADTPAKQAAALSVPQANGLTVLDNAVLGLKNQANDIPVIQPVQSSNASKVKFQLGNVSKTAIEASGARVKYRVYTSTKPGGKDGKVSAPAAADAKTEMDLPADGVQYYLIEVDTGAVK